MTPARLSDESSEATPSPQERTLARVGRFGWRDILPDLVILVACVAAIVGIWMAAGQRVALERREAVEAAMRSNANLAIAFEQQVSRTLKAAEQVAALVRDQYVREGDRIDLRKLVDQRVIRDAAFTIVSVVDQHGEVVASTTRSAPGRVSYVDRPFFTVQRDGALDTLFVNPPVLGRVSGLWQVPMSLRISRPDGSFGGVVVMSVSPDTLTGFHAHAHLSAHGLIELTGLDGVVRARKIGDVSSFGLDASDLPWFERRAEEASGAFIDQGAALDQVRRIVSYRSMAEYPLMVTVGTAYANDLADVEHRRIRYLIAAWGASAAAVVFGAVLIALLARQRAAARALHASEAVYRATFNQAAMGIAHIAPDGRILGANGKYCAMLGYALDELRGRSIFALGDPADENDSRRLIAGLLSDAQPGGSPELEKTYRRADGTTLWVCEALGVITDTRGRPDFLVAVTQDITARKDLEARLQHAALHDPLTSLPNRVVFMDRLTQVLESARRHGRRAAALYVDLDGFKAVNDHHGHTAGDRLLMQVAQRLTACVRAEDTASRFGGDEFGIVLANLARTEDCEAVGRKIVDALSQPFDLDGVRVLVSASVGAAVFPDDGEVPATLLAHADAAMYAAKDAGKNRFSRSPQADCSGGSTR